MRKLGINAGSFPGLTALDAIPYIKAAGFDAIFTGFKNDELVGKIAEALAENDMQYDTIHAPFKHINDMWLPGEGGDQMLSELITTADACAKHKIPVMVVHLSSGVSAPCVNDLGHERFDRLVNHCGEIGVTVAFENQRKIGNLSFVLELYEDLPHVGFCWDNGHEACFTPGREYMPLFGKMLCALHIHDNMLEYNRDIHLLPFDGKIDFERFAEHIRNSGFTGTLMLEALPKNSNFYTDFTPEQFYGEAYKRAAKLRAMVDGE